jgi:tetratricopeptide (TPR) repeat protein
LLGGWRAMRGVDPLARTVAAAALAGFAYWTVHGSFDWFWEFAGLGASAFALLGIACSLVTVRARASAPAGERPTSAASGPALGHSVAPVTAPAGVQRSVGARAEHGRPVARLCLWATVVALGLAAVASLVAPWLSERQVQSAASIWSKAPLVAYARLNDAANLNPLSDRPYLVAGSIALRFGDIVRAEHDFALALKRVPGDAYATLELGAIASELGERAHALALLESAVRLNPRDPLARQALRTVRTGRRVSVEALNHSILLNAQRFA